MPHPAAESARVCVIAEIAERRKQYDTPPARTVKTNGLEHTGGHRPAVGHREAIYAGQSQSPHTAFARAIALGRTGICLLLWFAFDYNYWYRRAWWIYLLGLALLLLVFAPGVGAKISGARRWIQIAGVRLLQPAELAKLALIMALARLFGAPGRNPCRRRVVAVGLILTLAMFLLIAAQPDMGTALVLLPVLGAIMFAAGVPARMLWRLVGMGAAALAVVLALLLMPPVLGWDEARHDALLERFGISAYQKNRIMVFLQRDADPLNELEQSSITNCSRIGRVGKGFRRELKTFWASCRTVAPNDFIFRSSPKSRIRRLDSHRPHMS